MFRRAVVLLAVAACSAPPMMQPCGGHCATGTVCVHDQCIPQSCPSQTCTANEVCLSGTCASVACVDVTCTADQTCANGMCFAKQCVSSMCASTEVCVNEACADARCIGVLCPTGQACVEGACVSTSCNGVPCPAGLVCSNGTCVDPACFGVLCPPGEICINGACGGCDDGFYILDGGCAPQTANGAPCTDLGTCQSGHCTQGVCCDQDCQDPCQSCASGTCLTLDAGAPASCAPFVCNGATTCPLMCASDSDCDSAHYCAGGACEVKGGPAAACTRDEMCQSAHCTGTLCCDRACAGGCETCTSGTCTPLSASTVCRAAAGDCDVAETCGGDGGSCPPDALAAVDAGCTSDGNACTADICNGAGVCLHPNLPNGTACGASSMCVNGSCPVGTPPTAGTASITGTAQTGQTLTAVPSGFMLGSPAGTYHYVWQQCATAACTAPVAIGTDSATYVAADTDIDTFIRVGIFAQNICTSGCGSSMTAFSAAVGAVAGVLPTGGTVAITGATTVGSTLTATSSAFGLGTPAGTFTYVWQRCTSSACSGPTVIATHTSAMTTDTYALVAADAGKWIRVQVTVTNTCAVGCGASAPVFSAAVGAICDPPTKGTASISGAAQVGATLTANPSGFALGTPAGTYHYQWQRCAGSGCASPVNIGNDAKTLGLVQADGGNYIRVGVHVTNGCGTTPTVYSAVTAVVKAVTLTKGAACSLGSCTTSACRFYKVDVVGFGGGSHTVTCDASNLTNPWDTYSASSFPSSVCCYGFPGKTAWVTVDGLKSNNLTW
jgi:hypothetical protein